ncbi:MAG: alginate export family protein [Cyanobacteriota bacterium]
MLASSTPFIGSANPTIYKNLDFFSTENKEKELNKLDQKLYGFWSNNKFCPEAEIDLFGYLDDNRSMKNSLDAKTKEFKQLSTDKKQITLGGNYKGNYGNFSSLIEGAYQFGKNQQNDLKTNKLEVDDNLSAYLASGQIFYAPVKEFKIGLGADIISGDANGKSNGVFELLYGTNHLFYGYMDYFTNIPKDTKNLGLNDFYLTTEWKQDKFPISANLNLHYMNSNQPNKVGENNFGSEIDLTVKYQVVEKSLITFGTSAFIEGNLMKNDTFFGKSSSNISYWSYLMLTHSL